VVRGLRVVVFDLDGVLVPFKSSWEYLHRYFGLLNDGFRKLNVDLFTKGLISYGEWMRRDLSLIVSSRGCVKRGDVVRAFSEVNLADGAMEVCEYLLSRGYEVAIVSGGINILAELVGSKLGIKRIYANKLVFDSNECLLPVGIEVVNPLRKDVVIKELSDELHIQLSEFMYVGDSEWDLSAFKVVGYPVVINCDSCDVELGRLRKHVYFINNLRELINITRMMGGK